jgi:hypothetical protein
LAGAGKFSAAAFGIGADRGAGTCAIAHMAIAPRAAA